MTITLFGLKNCDTCKKALAEIKAAGQQPEFVDIRAEADLARKVPEWLKVAGDKLVNRSSTTWRGLSEEARATDPATLLSAHPALMKRPLIEADGALYLGWDAATRAALLP